MRGKAHEDAAQPVMEAEGSESVDADSDPSALIRQINEQPGALLVAKPLESFPMVQGDANDLGQFAGSFGWRDGSSRFRDLVEDGASSPADGF